MAGTNQEIETSRHIGQLMLEKFEKWNNVCIVLELGEIAFYTDAEKIAFELTE